MPRPCLGHGRGGHASPAPAAKGPWPLLTWPGPRHTGTPGRADPPGQAAAGRGDPEGPTMDRDHATPSAAQPPPRGVLYHRYRLAADGTITDARIVPPTSQN